MLKTETRLTLSLTPDSNNQGGITLAWQLEEAPLGEPWHCSSDDLQPLTAALQGYREACVRHTTPENLKASAVQSIATELLSCCFTPRWQELEAELLSVDTPILLTLSSSEPELLAWPLETVKLPDQPDQPLAQRAGIHLRRLPAGSQEPVRCCTTLPAGPLRIFFLAQDASDSEALAREERAFLQSIGEAMDSAGQEILPRVCDETALDAIAQGIQAFQPHIVHISSTVRLDDNGVPSMNVDAPSGRCQSISPTVLEKELLHDSGVQCVVISAPPNRSGESPATALHAFAHQLSRQASPFVMAHSAALDSKASPTLFQKLYGALAGSEHLDAALHAAVAQVQREHGFICSGLPALYGENARSPIYNSSPDAPRIHPEPLTEHTPLPDQAVLKVPHPFTGRRMERMSHEETLHNGACQVLLLNGPEGVGKSALAARLTWHLSRGKHIPIVLQSSPANPISVHRLVEAVGYVLQRNGLEEEHSILDSEQLKPEDRLTFIIELLNRRLCTVIYLDGLDHALTPEGSFKEPLLGEWLSQMMTRLSGLSRMVITTRLSPKWQVSTLPHTVVEEKLSEVPEADFLKSFFNHSGLIRRVVGGDMQWADVSKLYPLFLSTFAPVRLLLNWADSLPIETLRSSAEKILAHDKVTLNPYENHAPGMDAAGQTLMADLLSRSDEADVACWRRWAVTRLWLPVSSLNDFCEMESEGEDAIPLEEKLPLWAEQGVAQKIPATDTSEALFRLAPFVRDALQSPELGLKGEAYTEQHGRMGELLRTLILMNRSSELGLSWFDLLLEARSHFFQAQIQARFFEFTDSTAQALSRHGHFEAAIRLQMEAREWSGTPQPMVAIARLYLDAERPDEAHTWLERAIEASTGGQFPHTEGAALQTLAGMAVVMGQKEQAQNWLNQALKIQTQHEDAQGAAASHNQLAALAMREGNHDLAERHLTDALPLWKASGDRSGRAGTLHQLGIIQLQNGNPGEAMRSMEKALNLYRLMGSGEELAVLLPQLGSLYYQKGNMEAAKDYLEESLGMLEGSATFKPQLSYVLHQLATIKMGMGELESAETHLKHSLTLKQELEDRRGEAATFFQMGRLAKEKDKPEEAMRLIAISYQIDTEIGNPDAHQELELFQHFASTLEIPEHEADAILRETWESYGQDKGRSLIQQTFPVKKTIPINLA
uniref:AAA+ ATPase domain-containing protein n=1 Tax=Magnetococcus massalia (strain MO-1) TaxID=451514 RepID=A0A1S7LG27_MAGMO|nr:conserved protein of unknown function [Candidatus Magnetococcus massalia]